jgi:hypothetical protein
MTLVACLTALDSPILLGDFLVSDKQQTGDFDIAKRKIRRLGSTIGIGWAGNQVGVDTVVSELQRNLDHGAGKQELEAALLRIDPNDMPGALTLVGWVVDGEADAFHWQSTYPGTVNWGGPWYIGSGGALMDYLLPNGIETLPGDEGRDPRLSALEVAAHLTGSETIYREHPELKIGPGFEVMWWNGAEFEYIGPVQYFATQYTYDADGNLLELRMLGRHFRYFARDELSVIIPYEGGKAKEAYIFTPIGQPVPGKTDRAARDSLMKELRDSTGWPLGPDTEFYGVRFDLVATGYKNRSFVSAFPRGFKTKHIEIIESGNGLFVDLSGAAMRWMFETMEKA